jgi:hypothetical protein
MAVYSDVRKAIRTTALASLSEFTNPQVIFSNSNGTEPAESYAVINILRINQIGHHSTSTLASISTAPEAFGFDQQWDLHWSESTGYFLPVQVCYEILVQFSFIGSLSGDMAQSFTQRINNNPLSLEELKKNKLGLMRKSQIRRAPQKRDTKWVEYHNMDVTFNYIVQTIQPIDWVESVIVDSEQTGVFTVPEGIIIP